MFIWIFRVCSIIRIILVGSYCQFECNLRHLETPRGHLEDCKWFLVFMSEFHCCWRLLVSTGDHCCIYMLYLWASLLKEQSAVTTAVSSADLLMRQQQMSWHWQTCIHLRMFSSLFWLIAIIQLPLCRVPSLVLTILRMPLILAAKFYQKREGRLIICTIWSSGFKSNIVLSCPSGWWKEERSQSKELVAEFVHKLVAKLWGEKCGNGCGPGCSNPVSQGRSSNFLLPFA